jgi:hypothetical protein
VLVQILPPQICGLIVVIEDLTAIPDKDLGDELDVGSILACK